MDRPPHNESFGCPCENGPRHGRAPCSAHGDRSWKVGEIVTRRFRSGPVRGIILATGIALPPGLLGCSRATNTSEAEASRDRERHNLIGEHFYAFPDGSRLDVDFLGDRLTLDIKTRPNAAPERVTSPASGRTYVGRNLNVSISGGDTPCLAGRNTRPQRRRSTTGKALARGRHDHDRRRCRSCAMAWMTIRFSGRHR